MWYSHSPMFFTFVSMAIGQWHNCPKASEVTLMGMGKHKSEPKHNKTQQLNKARNMRVLPGVYFRTMAWCTEDAFTASHSQFIFFLAILDCYTAQACWLQDCLLGCNKACEWLVAWFVWMTSMNIHIYIYIYIYWGCLEIQCILTKL